MARSDNTRLTIIGLCIAGLGLGGAFAKYSLGVIVGTSERITRIEGNVAVLTESQKRIETKLDNMSFGSNTDLKPKRVVSYP